MFQKFSPLGRPHESCKSFQIITDLVVYFWGFAWGFFRLAYVCPFLWSQDYPTSLGNGAFTVALTKAHYQAWYSESSTCWLVWQAWVPDCQSFQPASAEENGTGRANLWSGKRLHVKILCKTVNLLTSGPLSAMSVVWSCWKRRQFETVKGSVETALLTQFSKEAVWKNQITTGTGI